MKFKLLLTFLLGCSLFSGIFAQATSLENIIINGKVIDAETSQPLAYASVGIIEKPLGTIADSSGIFSFSVNNENIDDTLLISMVGYADIRIAVKDFTNSDKLIKLQKRIGQLSEVIIGHLTEKFNSEIIGRQNVSKLVQVSIHNKNTATETIGSEMGMKYKTNRENARLKDFNFYISANNFNYIKFRINVYAVRNDNPDTLLCNTQVFATLDDYKTGWVKINLEDYNIQLNKEFIVTLQWIESRMDKVEKPVTILPVAATPFSKNCYMRIASQDKWKKMGFNLSNFVTIVY